MKFADLVKAVDADLSLITFRKAFSVFGDVLCEKVKVAFEDLEVQNLI